MLAVVKDHTAAGPESRRDNAQPDQSADHLSEDIQSDTETSVGLSDTAIADLAQAMCVPEELFRMIIDRYPELTSALVCRFRTTEPAN
jgi:hypothetical protein